MDGFSLSDKIIDFTSIFKKDNFEEEEYREFIQEKKDNHIISYDQNWDDGFSFNEPPSNDILRFDIFDIKETIISDDKFVFSKNIIYHKLPKQIDIIPFFKFFYNIIPFEKVFKVKSFLEYFTLQIFGKRNIKKSAIDVSQLNPDEKEIYDFIVKSFNNNPQQKQRITHLISSKHLTKRTISYFLVHYCSLEKEMSYYLDKRTYPYKIIGDISNPNQPFILTMIQNGEPIYWINLYKEYRNTKGRFGRKGMSPYARDAPLYFDHEQKFSLGELKFYIWFDNIGGFELLNKFLEDVKKKKAMFDQLKCKNIIKSKRGRKRKNFINDIEIKNLNSSVHSKVIDDKIEHIFPTEDKKPLLTKKTKRNIVLRNRDGKNYKSFFLNYVKPLPVISKNCDNTLQISELFKKK
jgi:hypothetical protein